MISAAEVTAVESAILDALPTAIYVTDATGRITYHNDAAAQLWGLHPEIGSARWCGSWRLYRTDGSPLPHDQCPLALTLKTGEPVRGIEAIAERPDGTRIRFLPFPTPLKDASGKLVGAVNLLIETDDFYRADIDSQRLAAIVANSDDAIVSKTLQGYVTSWNDGARRIFGYDESEMVGESITKIIPPELHQEEHHVLARLRAGERIEHYETVRVAKDGRRLDISLTVSPVRDRGGNIIGASKVARDITERKHIERSQRLLMGELSHRVKNALAIVQAIATQSLRPARDPSDFATSFTGRVQSLARAHDLLSETRWEGVELGALVRDQVLLGVADDRITLNGPAVTLDPQPALHVAMVLNELGTNARKYGALSVAHGHLAIDWRVTASAGERDLLLSWRESNGPRVTASSERGFGTRLIEESLVAHSGKATIAYDSNGLVCQMKLPLPEHEGRIGAYTVPGIALTSSASGDLNRLRGKRILIVEDEPLIAMEIEATLRDAGCVVAGATGDPVEGERLSELGCDAALLDANLGGKMVDGLAAALTRRGVPFLFITGYGRENMPEAFRQNAIVSKPFTREELLVNISRLFQPISEPRVIRLAAGNQSP